VNSAVTGGGEYPNQDGFGWTNKVLVIYPHANDNVRGAAENQSSPAAVR
jgi:neutral trehalase